MNNLNYVVYEERYKYIQEKVNRLLSTTVHLDVSFKKAVEVIFAEKLAKAANREEELEKYVDLMIHACPLGNWVRLLDHLLNEKLTHLVKEGKFIVFEGTDGSGKDTVLNHVKELYPDFYYTREPGGTPVAEELREGILKTRTGDSPVPKCELLMYYASRAQHIENVIVPMRQAGINVVSSRFYDSSYAYQQNARGIKNLWLDNLSMFVCEHPLSVPTAVVTLFLSDEKLHENTVKTIEKRAKETGVEVDRIEAEGEDFLKLTNDYYKNVKSLAYNISSDDDRKTIATHIYSYTNGINDMVNSAIDMFEKYHYDTYQIQTFIGSLEDLFDRVDRVMFAINKEINYNEIQ